MTTTEVSDSLERVDNIVNMLDGICDEMDGFSSAEEAWFSSITETLRTWRYVMQKLTRARKKIKRTSGFVEISRFLFAVPTTKFPRGSYKFTAGSSEPSYIL